jgi:hypothetical protein
VVCTVGLAGAEVHTAGWAEEGVRTVACTVGWVEAEVHTVGWIVAVMCTDWAEGGRTVLAPAVHTVGRAALGVGIARAGAEVRGVVAEGDAVVEGWIGTVGRSAVAE